MIGIEIEILGRGQRLMTVWLQESKDDAGEESEDKEEDAEEEEEEEEEMVDPKEKFEEGKFLTSNCFSVFVLGGRLAIHGPAVGWFIARGNIIKARFGFRDWELGLYHDTRRQFWE